MSNFYPSPFVDDEKREWPTVEHYFQAMKYHKSPDYVEHIRTAPKPKDAFDLGRKSSNTFRADWEESKDDVMLIGLRYKFTQNEELRKELLSTGDAKLIEHTRNDKYWADGGDGKGKNMLGILLMKLRDELSK